MILMGLDFETYYDDEYSLSKMTSEEYVRDPRFEVILVGVTVAGQQKQWFSGTHEEIRQWLLQWDWSQVICVGHNLAEFDALILTEHFGIRAKVWQCTLAIARALGSGRGRYSLEALAIKYGLPEKGKEVIMAKGKRRGDFTAQELAAYGNYCAHDSWLTLEIYVRQSKELPRQERMVAHWFARMFAEPRLQIDGRLTRIVLHYHRQMQGRLLERIADFVGMREITGELDLVALKKMLRSDDRFAALLRSMGVKPGKKLSVKKSEKAGKDVYTYAFAKTDPFMEQILSDPDPMVAAAAEARVGVKSSIVESRLLRFIGISERGMLPAPFAYGKTHTHRAAGAGKINLQNMGRPPAVNPDTPRGAPIMVGDDLFQLRYRTLTDKGEVDLVQVCDPRTREERTVKAKDARIASLRDCIMAPQGKRIVVADSSAIELRVAHTLAGQMDTVFKLREKAKLYEEFATDLYGFPVNKTDHPRERLHGKVAMLQLQYQSGAGSFQNAARVMGGIVLTDEESQHTVDTYRGRFDKIKTMWWRCQKMIEYMANGVEDYIDEWGLCRTAKNKIIMPNGLIMYYPDLREQEGGKFGKEWVYYDKEDRREKRLYGGQVFENLCQSLARIIVFEQSLVVEKKYGNTPDTGVALTAHDEMGVVVREEDADECKEFAIGVMSESPKWWPDLVLECEADHGVRYGTAK